MSIKRRNKSYFAHSDRIEYWYKIYEQDDILGARYTERMDVALRWLDELGLPMGSAILDAGCGPGRVALEVARRGHSVCGLDFSYGMVASAQGRAGENGLTLQVLQGDVDFLPIQDNSFDAIICLGVISYLPRVKPAFKEMARVLRPGGALIISFVNRARAVRYLDPPQRVATKVRSIIRRLSVSRPRNEPQGSVIRMPHFIPEMQSALRGAGLQTTDYRTIPLEVLTFMGRDVYPRKFATAVTLLFERFSNVPVVESFGGMCIIKAEKEKVH